MKFYGKQWDFKETEGSNPARRLYVPGSSSAAEEIHQFDFGFEICFDHENGALKAKSTGVDFHILVSDSVPTKTGNACLIVGGYLIHASSDHTATGVWGRSAMSVLRVGGPDSGALATNQVAYWLVDVQARPDVQPVVVPQVNVMGATGPTTASGKKLPFGAVRLPGLGHK